MSRTSLGSLFISVLCVWACSSSSSNTTEEVCKPSQTQACEGDGCTGVQTCLASGKGFTSCNCSSGGTGGNAGTSSGGGSGGTDASVGGSGGASGGAGGNAGSAGSGGAAGSDACPGDCAAKALCCESLNPQGILVLRSIMASAGVCDCDAVCQSVCQSGSPPLSTMMTCKNCVESQETGTKLAQVENGCAQQSSCVMIKECLGSSCW